MNTESHPHKTPSYTLTCRMSHESAALERLCQVIRIRGFRIAKMAVESVLEGTDEALDIALTIHGARSVAMLQSQLEKLAHCSGGHIDHSSHSACSKPHSLTGQHDNR